MDACGAGKSVVLRSDGNRNAFLSGPLELREGVTLVVEKGVTVYASRDPKLFDSVPGTCGTSGPESRACKPLLSATLPEGERLQVVLPPACEAGTVSLTIRKPAKTNRSLSDYEGQGFFQLLGRGTKALKNQQ